MVGLIFGFSSLFRAITTPTPISPLFYNPIISIIPRILIGLTTYYSYKMLKKLDIKSLKKLSFISWSIIVIFLIFMILRNINNSLSKFNLILLALLLLISIGMLIYTFKGIKENASIVIASFIGSMTNSILVMGGIYLIYAQKYALAMNLDTNSVASAILTVIIAQSLPEAIVSCIITSSVVSSLKMAKR